MTKKKGVDVLAIIACVLAIFIFVVPFLKTYQAKAGKRTGNSQSQYDVTKQVIEALDEKDSSSYQTQIKVFVLSFAGLIITALILLIPSFIYSCKGNRPKAWKFILLTSIFALLANASYMYAMKCDEDLMNVYSNSRVYKLEPNALFIILLVFIVALMVTSIVKMSLSKKQPA